VSKQKTARSAIPNSSLLNFVTLYTLQAFATPNSAKCFLKCSTTYAVLVQRYVKKISGPLVGGLRGTTVQRSIFNECHLKPYL